MRWPARALLVMLVACSVAWASTAAGRSPSRPSPAGPPGTVWVTNQTLNTVAAYDARTGELLRTVKTVEHHVSAILSKLGARTRSEAARAAARLGVGGA